jgi:hypothetical protein
MNHESSKPRHRNNAAEWIMWFCLLPAFGNFVAIVEVQEKTN